MLCWFQVQTDHLKKYLDLEMHYPHSQVFIFKIYETVMSVVLTIEFYYTIYGSFLGFMKPFQLIKSSEYPKKFAHLCHADKDHNFAWEPLH